jgi:hypothetical protein
MNGAEFLRLGDERSFLFAVFIRLTITIGLLEREFTWTLRFCLVARTGFNFKTQEEIKERRQISCCQGRKRTQFWG